MSWFLCRQAGGTITGDRKDGRNRSGTEMNKLMYQHIILGNSGRGFSWRIPPGSSFQEVPREADLPPETTGEDGAIIPLDGKVGSVPAGIPEHRMLGPWKVPWPRLWPCLCP